MTDSSGGVQNEILYDSFGNMLTTQPGNIYATSVLFTGQWFRASRGVYDLRARLYDPNIGRFTTQDNIRLTAGDLTNSNLYLFVRDNPGNMWDPNGHEGLLELLTTIGISQDKDAEKAEGDIQKGQAAKATLRAKLFDVYMGMESGSFYGGQGAASGGLLPHMFIYVDQKQLHVGNKYDITGIGLYYHTESLKEVTKTAYPKGLWKITQFSTLQYAAWVSSTWIVGRSDLVDRTIDGLLGPHGLIPAEFSYIPFKAANCYTFTLIAAATAYLIGLRS